MLNRLTQSNRFTIGGISALRAGKLHSPRMRSNFSVSNLSCGCANNLSNVIRRLIIGANTLVVAALWSACKSKRLDGTPLTETKHRIRLIANFTKKTMLTGRL